MKFYIVTVLFLITLLGCNLSFEYMPTSTGSFGIETYGENRVLSGNYSEVNELLRLKAYFAGESYVNAGLSYEWGGDQEVYVPTFSASRSYGVDCSGLVINLFEYAVDGTSFYMPFTDSTAHNIYVNYTVSVEEPQKGDLIFWINEETRNIYHVGILDYIVAGKYYYFIDSTETSTIYGVTHRYSEITSLTDVRRFIVKN